MSVWHVLFDWIKRFTLAEVEVYERVLVLVPSVVHRARTYVAFALKSWEECWRCLGTLYERARWCLYTFNMRRKVAGGSGVAHGNPAAAAKWLAPSKTYRTPWLAAPKSHRKLLLVASNIFPASWIYEAAIALSLTCLLINWRNRLMRHQQSRFGDAC